ncbi:MAG: hypothetical protein ACKOWF_14340, partial [Chloroflexota bacterium]
MRTRDAPMPTLSLSMRSPLACGSGRVARALACRGNPPLDLDLTAGSAARAIAGVAGPPAFGGLAPSSVWLPDGPDTAGTAADRAATVWEKRPPALVAFDLPVLPDGRFIELVAAAAAAAAYRKATGGTVALALRAR